MSTHILVIEDEPSIQDNIKLALEIENFQGSFKNTGNDGLKFLENNQVDLIILDIGLPDINGFEVCKKIREKNSTPIIFLTARNSEIDTVVGLEIGADDYLTKPFSPRELIARIKAILKRVNTNTLQNIPNNITVGFELNEKKHQITFQGKVLDLTRYEYLILKYLVKNPGQVFSRDQLMMNIWDDPGSSLDRTIDAHIKSIRAKCKKISKEDPITTHRGLGYSLKEN
jgi:two-component system catabolic regulation response regulator CreB